MANYLGQAILTRSNPLVCQLVVYRGKAQGRKQYTYAGTAQGIPHASGGIHQVVTRTLARERLYRLP